MMVGIPEKMPCFRQVRGHNVSYDIQLGGLASARTRHTHDTHTATREAAYASLSWASSGGPESSSYAAGTKAMITISRP